MDYSNQVRDSTKETFVISTPSNRHVFPFPGATTGRAYGLGRASRPASTPTESPEHRRAQRRHGLGRPPGNPASNSHRRRRYGVDLFGRASRGNIATLNLASCLGRDRAGRSNRTKSPENRCAQRRHGLERPPRIPASNSHGRLRSGVHLFGRASETIIASDGATRKSHNLLWQTLTQATCRGIPVCMF